LSAAAEKSGRMSALPAAHNNYTEDTPPTPEERLIKKDEQDHLSRMIMNRINDLPDHQKKLIFLRFYEGLSYGDIVQLTGLSQRTVYNKIHEALKKLRLDIANSRHSQSAFLVLTTFLSSFTRTI
jgi:RNA polymerase sigma-70 factor (ECF subfamily)